MKYKIATVLMLLAILYASAFGRDETVTVKISGRVLDQNGAAVIGANIFTERPGSSIRNKIVTDADGAFTVELTRGPHVLRVEATGFEPQTRKVEVSGAAQLAEPFILGIASTAAFVTVSDDAPYSVTDVLSATKTFTALRDVPQSITVVKREQMADQNATSI